MVEVPRGCNLIQELESRKSAPFDFDDPLAALEKVFVNLPYAEGMIGHWTFHRLRELHRENVYHIPYYPSANLTVWWGVENRITASTEPCYDNTTQCSRFLIGMEAVFPVFIYERLGSVATLLAEFGGAISLVISVFGFCVVSYRFVKKHTVGRKRDKKAEMLRAAALAMSATVDDCGGM